MRRGGAVDERDARLARRQHERPRSRAAAESCVGRGDLAGDLGRASLRQAELGVDDARAARAA